MSAEPAVLVCSCGRRLSVASAVPGQKTRCPGCGNVLSVGPGGAQGESRPTGPVEPLELESAAGRTCSICQATMRPGEDVCMCPACRSPYHRECWDEVGGCAVYGCEFMPRSDARHQQGPDASQGWGEEKVCPNCGRQVRSAAVKCRFCRARFPTAMPMTPGEYSQWRTERGQSQSARALAITYFGMSLVGFLAPVLLPVGLVLLWRTWPSLTRAGGMHRIMFCFGIGLSLLYTLMIAAVLLAGP